VPGQPEQLGFQIMQRHLLQRGGERDNGHREPPERGFVIAFRMAAGSDNSGRVQQ
jgi:hypothetical protein